MTRSRVSSAIIGVLCAMAALACLALATQPASGEQPGAQWWNPANRPTPDSQINASGAPLTGTTNAGEVRGYIDGHNHLMSNEGFGGRLICGKTFDPAGIDAALKDCPGHYPDGAGALFENLTSSPPGGKHDPVGWPTFSYWPRHDSMSHQQNYYAWLERAWRGGQRILVQDLVSNRVLCTLYARDRGCDEMDSIRLQARKTHQLQDYIDGIYGGPGRGFFRIVTSPQQARSAIAEGKMAVVLGVETSEPFGCRQRLELAQCSRAQIDAGLTELHRLGVRSVFLCHKFDNALCGVRFDEGTTGIAVNVGQFLSTGTWWEREKCTGVEEDNPPFSFTRAQIPTAERSRLAVTAVLPRYPAEGRKCNRRGLSALGEYAVRGLIKRSMMLEVDHMSVKAADRALDILEASAYPGVLSSHSWMAPSFLERLYRVGGFKTGYDKNTREFLAEMRDGAELRHKYGKGYGYGSDLNGVGGWPAPREDAATNPVRYPYTAFDGTRMDRQRTGERTWDVNLDGVAHVGLIPDWIEDLRLVGGDHVQRELATGAESYLKTWEATNAWRAPRDLAAGRPVTASSTQWTLTGDLKPTAAVDGNPRTRWASAWSDRQWFCVDLGGVHDVARVTVNWDKGTASSQHIETSKDGSNWHQVWQQHGFTAGLQSAHFAPTAARYVRWTGTRRARGPGYSFFDFGVFTR